MKVLKREAAGDFSGTERRPVRLKCMKTRAWNKIWPERSVCGRLCRVFQGF